MATKVDFKRTLDSYKAKAGEFRLVELPTLQYLMVDGQGDPNTSPAYQQALQTLYPVAYKLKFASKRELGRDYVVPPFEGLWWADDMAAFTSRRNKHEWRWTMMLLAPEWLGADMVEAAREQAGAKNPPARLDDVRLQELTESICVQTLHVGSFDDEGPVLERMHSEFLPVNGMQLTGKHHEVYLSDFRKVVAQKLRTILRQPVLRAR